MISDEDIVKQAHLRGVTCPSCGSSDFTWKFPMFECNKCKCRWVG
jgi:hypothetical protein